MKTYTSSTYLKGIQEYIYFQYTEPGMHIVIKKILKAEPFILNEDGIDLKILDNNYYVMEIIPMDKNYICRIHLDENKNIIERYYILSLKNEFIDNIPVFNNLKTAYVICDFQRKKYNEEHLEEILKDGIIDNNEYKKIKEEFTSLIDEINSGENEIFNMNYKEIIEMIGVV